MVFILIRLSGDPTQLLLPPDATPGDRAAFRRAHGLDQPLHIQYLAFLGNIARGDLGDSFVHRQPALRSVLDRLPATLELTLAAMAIVVVVGIPVGLVAAVKRGSLIDKAAMLAVLLGQSMATFWVGILLILIFAVQFRWLPVSGRGSWQQLVLPAVTLSLYMAALVARMTRSSLLDVWGQDYLRTARAKGLKERVIIFRHALRAALIPIVTVLGIQFGGALAGAIVTESIFAWPGLGTLVLDAIYRRDYPVVQAAVLVVAVLYLTINLCVDLLYIVLDPRLR